MHAVSDPPGLHACCMRIQGAEQDPEAVGQVVNTGHSLDGMFVEASKPYRLRMRVQVGRWVGAPRRGCVHAHGMDCIFVEAGEPKRLTVGTQVGG